MFERSLIILSSRCPKQREGGHQTPGNGFQAITKVTMFDLILCPLLYSDYFFDPPSLFFLPNHTKDGFSTSIKLVVNHDHHLLLCPFSCLLLIQNGRPYHVPIVFDITQLPHDPHPNHPHCSRLLRCQVNIVLAFVLNFLFIFGLLSNRSFTKRR